MGASSLFTTHPASATYLFFAGSSGVSGADWPQQPLQSHSTTGSWRLSSVIVVFLHFQGLEVGTTVSPMTKFSDRISQERHVLNHAFPFMWRDKLKNLGEIIIKKAFNPFKSLLALLG